MARKMIVQLENGSSPVLTEEAAEDEGQLQEMMKNNPDLLPVDEFGMAGPLMVVGRETTLPSGAVDLVAVARSGELLIVEFKTGPQNADFRAALAQLLDYGADLWQMSYEDFEATVARRYFESEHCNDARVRGKPSIIEAAKATWNDSPESEQEEIDLRQRLSEQLSSGDFHYLVVAQRFTSTIERTIEYLNAVIPGPRFYAVELVRFTADNISAFESRTVLKPSRSSGPTPKSALDEDRFLEAIEEESYREALRELIQVFRGLGLTIFWGTSGISIRMPTSDKPLSVAWLFPPGRSGWMGLTDLTLGFTEWSVEHTPTVQPALKSYVEQVGRLDDAIPVTAQSFQAYRLGPDATISHRRQIADILAELVKRVAEEG